MGREIYTQIVKLNKETNIGEEVCESEYCCCGRDECTNFVTNFIYNNKVDEEDDYYYDFDLCNDKNGDYFKENLKEYANEEAANIEKAQICISDLREARRHASNLDTFLEFSEHLEDLEDYIKRYNLTATSLLNDLKNMFIKAQDYNCADTENLFRVRLIVSE